MMLLNIHNVEDLIFYDKELRKKLPEFSQVFAQWNFSKQHTNFRQLTKRTLADFLNSLTDEHIKILSQHFNSSVSIDKIDYHSIRNQRIDIEDAELLLESPDHYNFDVYRDRDSLYITFWR